MTCRMAWVGCVVGRDLEQVPAGIERLGQGRPQRVLVVLQPRLDAQHAAQAVGRQALGGVPLAPAAGSPAGPGRRRWRPAGRRGDRPRGGPWSGSRARPRRTGRRRRTTTGRRWAARRRPIRTGRWRTGQVRRRRRSVPPLGLRLELEPDVGLERLAGALDLDAAATRSRCTRWPGQGARARTRRSGRGSRSDPAWPARWSRGLRRPTAPSWSKVISMPVSRGTSVSVSSGTVPMTRSGWLAWNAHVSRVWPASPRSVNR